MSEPTPFTRRDFLSGSLALVATSAAAPLFVQRAAHAADAEKRDLAVASKPASADERVLVIVQLAGGNDGLNTVVPLGAREYFAARPTIAIPEKEAIAVPHSEVGLHPALRPIAEMMSRGIASAIVGVGYPNPNRSHFASMDIWHTADPENGTSKGYGWVGKSMDQLRDKANGKIDPAACICVGRDAVLAANGKNVKPVAFEQANTFRWIGPSMHESLGPVYDKINRAGMIGMRDGVAREASATTAAAAEVPRGDQAAFVMQTALDAQVTSDKLRRAVGKQTVTTFPQNNKLADQLRMVTQFIRAGVPTRVYYVTLGGFDTHANQLFTQQRLLGEFATAMSAFYAELKAIGQDGRVLTMAFSEFGRRVEQNASGGTDHGTAGPMFLFGPSIRPGVIGDYPSLKNLDNGDLIHTADFRCVYSSVLNGWMKIDSEKVLGNSFRPAAVLKGA